MSTDDRLKALYRASTRRAADAVAGEDIEQAIGRSGWPDEENTPLDRIAGSALHADVLRLVMEMGPDAEALSRDVAALRKPQAAPSRRGARSWMALAAGMGTAAVLIAGMGTLSRAPQPGAMPDGADAILSASFESEGTDSDAGPQEPQAIFQGDFDS